MKKILILAVLAISANVMAAPVPAAVTKAANALKAQSVRTVIKKVVNREGNPCIPEGTSYNVELQVKQASYNPMTNKVVYKWETAKTINVEKNGATSEVCAE